MRKAHTRRPVRRSRFWRRGAGANPAGESGAIGSTPLRTILSHGALMTLSVVFMIPFVWLVSTSFKSESHLSAFPPQWVPRADYYRLESGDWAEVVRNEIIAWEEEFNEQGEVIARRPLRSRVNLVDRWGVPLRQHVTDIDADGYPELLNTGELPASFVEALASRDVVLPGDVGVSTEQSGHLWIIGTDHERYFVLRQDDRLSIHRDTGTIIIPSEQITTRTVPTFRHYVQGVAAFKFDLFLQNTLFIAVIAVAGTVLSCSWVAFGFAILDWPGRDKLFYLMLATMMLPPQVTMIPLFLIFKWLGWINTYAPLLVPAFLGNAFFIFLLRQFFLTIPKDLIDAARVDGCSTFRIYWQIVMPLSIPALATVALFTFMGAWNDFMGPLLYVVDEAKYTLSLGLAMFKGRFASRYGEMMAVSVLLTLPIIVLFFFTQKTFIQGIKTSGMKG